MKLACPRLLSAVFLAVSLATARSQPLATLTIRSYTDLQQAVDRLARSLNPDSQANLGQELSKGLGLGEAAAFDAQRPWQIAVWYEGPATQPLVALKVPTADISRFKEGLSAQGMLRLRGQDWKQLEGGIGLISLRDAATLSAAEQTAMDQWKAETVPPPGQPIQLTLNLNEPLRKQALGMLSLAKSSMSQMFATNQAFAAAGTNPKAMGDIMVAYLELIETAVQGVQQVRLGLEASPDLLTVDEVVTAKPDTELARWLQKQDGRISDRELSLVDPQAVFSVVGHLGNSAIQMAWLKKFTALGLQAQNIGANDPLSRELDGLFATMFPMNFAVSAYWSERLDFAGAYGFPKSTAAKVYATMKGFLDKGFAGMVGPDKIYSAAAFQTNHHGIDQLPIDRFTLTINSNSPLLSMPGQSEQLLGMWPDGKVVLDYAVKDDRLLFASPDRMKEVLDPPAQRPSKWATPLSETTVMAGYMNFISLIQRTVATNPVLPGAVKEKLARLDPEGTSIEFRVSLDNQLGVSMRVPMKLFREARRMSGEP